MLKIGMLSKADSVKGQGVGSAYAELLRLLRKYGKDEFSLFINKNTRNCDLLHVHTLEPGSFLKMKFTRKPTVMSIHMTPEMARNSMRLPRLLMKIFEGYIVLVYKSADDVHIVNPDLKKEARSYGFKDSQIHYIPNFVSKKYFYRKSPAQRRAIREKYGLKETDFMCFADGQTRAGKGVQDFVAVARLLPDVRFIWAGGFSFGPLADGYHETKDMLAKLPPNVTFTGIVEREEINNLLNAADLFFFPSYQELFPMSILEAASVGLPLLLRDLPEYRNILTGRYRTAETHEEFAGAIRQIQTDRELYEKMAQDAESISREYSEERIYRIWEKFYKDCIRKKRKKRKK